MIGYGRDAKDGQTGCQQRPDGGRAKCDHVLSQRREEEPRNRKRDGSGQDGRGRPEDVVGGDEGDVQKRAEQRRRAQTDKPALLLANGHDQKTEGNAHVFEDHRPDEQDERQAGLAEHGFRNPAGKEQMQDVIRGERAEPGNGDNEEQQVACAAPVDSVERDRVGLPVSDHHGEHGSDEYRSQKGKAVRYSGRHVVEAHGFLAPDGLEQHDADLVVDGGADRRQHERDALPQKRSYDLWVEPEPGKLEETPVRDAQTGEREELGGDQRAEDGDEKALVEDNNNQQAGHEQVGNGVPRHHVSHPEFCLKPDQEHPAKGIQPGRYEQRERGDKRGYEGFPALARKVEKRV